MSIILAMPTVASNSWFARLRRRWDAFVREHVLEMEPDWSTWTGSPRPILPVETVVRRLAAS